MMFASSKWGLCRVVLGFGTRSLCKRLLMLELSRSQKKFLLIRRRRGRDKCLQDASGLLERLCW